MDREARSEEEITAEIVRIAMQDDEAAGMWHTVNGLPFGYHKLGAGTIHPNWEIAVFAGTPMEVANVLRRAAADVSKRWNMRLPFLGSSTVAM